MVKFFVSIEGYVQAIPVDIGRQLHLINKKLNKTQDDVIGLELNNSSGGTDKYITISSNENQIGQAAFFV